MKHTLRPSEREGVLAHKSTATKLILPFSGSDLRLGGFSVFVEQENFQESIVQKCGRRGSDDDFRRDMQVLAEIASLPSMDPFLLREKINRLQIPVARCYFEISEADAERMREHVSSEISRLVSLAFGSDGSQASALSKRLATLLLKDESSEQLEPLRQTLRLSKQEYAEGMFAWKGFLYYKWSLAKIEPTLAPVAKEVLSTKLLRASPDDKAHLTGSRDRIVEFLWKVRDQIRRTLRDYDKAFAALVERNQPGVFRSFLLRAPAMFVETGEQLATLNHVTSFWRFQFPNPDRIALPVDEAFEIFQEFESSLGGLNSPESKAA
ncbi:MAG: hypothetical protein ACFB2Z_06440 [Maricaulaceae bacterium]